MKFNFKRTLFYSFIFGLISISIAYIYIFNYYKKFVSESEMKNVVSEINKTETISPEFIKAYNKVHNYDETNSTNEFLFSLPYNILKGDNSERCPCFDANYGLLVWNTLERISLGIQLDKKVGSKKCFDYYLNNIAFPNNVIGVNKASLSIYKKELKNLNKLEMIELAISTKNPFFYNKSKRPEKVKIRLNEVLDRINNAN